MRLWVFLGTISVTFWDCSGLLFQRFHASSLQGNRSSIISMIWCRFRYHYYIFSKSRLLENAYKCWRSFGSFCASFFFSIFSVRACERSEAERGRCVVEAAPQAGPEDHFGGIICSRFVLNTTWDLPVLCNIASTIVLSVFWHLRFLVILADFGIPF